MACGKRKITLGPYKRDVWIGGVDVSRENGYPLLRGNEIMIIAEKRELELFAVTRRGPFTLKTKEEVH